MNSLTFKLNKEEVDGEILDCEYTATQDINNENIITVSWTDDGEYFEKHYDTCDVEYYLNNNIWIQII